MNLRRSGLLIEGLAASRVDPRGLTHDAPAHGFRFGQSDAATPPTRRSRGTSGGGLGLSSGRWGKESRSGESETSFRMPLSQSTARGIRLGDSRSQSHSGEISTSDSAPRSSFKIKLSKSDSASDSGDNATFDHDTRFPTKLHHDVHNMSAKDAHAELDKIWSRRHDVNPQARERVGIPFKKSSLHPHRRVQMQQPKGKLERYRELLGFGSAGRGGVVGAGRKGPRRIRTEPDLRPGQATVTGNKYMLPHTMPGIHHPDAGVRERAWKMQAQAHANALGDSYKSAEPERGQSRSTAPAQAHVIRDKRTGSMSISSTFHGRKFQHPGKNYEVLHTAISEALARSALLLENVPIRQHYASDERVRQAFSPENRKRTVSDENLRQRLAGATPEVAARLKSLMKQREMLRRGVGRKESPTSGAATITSAPQQAARDTVQRRYRGKVTQPVKPVAPSPAKTDVLPAFQPPSHLPADTPTRVQMPVARPGHVRTSKKVRQKQERSLEKSMQGREPEKTQVLPRVRTASVEILKPVLQEFVATTTSAWKSGIGPNDTISGGKGVRGATTTANVGHTTAQGAAVPDKKKREVKLPDLSRLPKTWDPITKQLERLQPANPGGVLTKIKPTRTQEALSEACVCQGFWALSSSRNGYGLDLPVDDYVKQYEDFRSACPHAHKASHAAFCSRCDNSFPSFVGGANVLRQQHWLEQNPFEKFPEPIAPRKGPEVSPYFGRM